MGRWLPPSNIGINEHIGRRLFDEPLLAGTADQPSFTGLLLIHFEEKRGDEYSLDRLGRSGIERGVVAYLKPRAEAAGTTFRNPKSFDGWAVVAARELVNARRAPSLAVIPSPVNNPEPNDNIYHAHVLKPQHMEAQYMALHLRHLFATYGKVHNVRREQSFWQWFSGIVSVINRPIIFLVNRLFGRRVP